MSYHLHLELGEVSRQLSFDIPRMYCWLLHNLLGDAHGVGRVRHCSLTFRWLSALGERKQNGLATTSDNLLYRLDSGSHGKVLEFEISRSGKVSEIRKKLVRVFHSLFSPHSEVFWHLVFLHRTV